MSQSYPRPDFLRKSLTWTSLNGPWSFTFDDTNTGLTQNWPSTGLPSQSTKITVPYAFQTPASGINLQEAHEVIWYERRIKDIRTERDRAAGNRLLLRFGAVDYESEVWVDGVSVTKHRGGYVPFDVDISDSISAPGGEARVTLRVRDSPTDLTQPRGKQYWGPVPESIFYTPTSGIWQNVWLEVVPAVRIGDSSVGTVLRGDDIESGKLRGVVAVSGVSASGGGSTVSVTTALSGTVIGKTKVDIPVNQGSGVFEVDVRVAEGAVPKEGIFAGDGVWHNGVALWAPDHPVLYDVVLQLAGPDGNVLDEVQTTAGMRSVTWENGDGTFRLNGKPYFQMLCLDQGYWSETGLTPPSAEALKEDIILAKNMGLNGCRKHQKVEDPAFLYYADRLGYLVWGEIANAYEFSAEYIDRFNDEWAQVVQRDRNHPCIVVWTPVNESWAYKNLKDNAEERSHIRSLYKTTK